VSRAQQSRGAAACIALKQRLWRELLSLVGDIKQRRVLDVGCGDGSLARILASQGAFVVGVDSRACVIAHANETRTAKTRFVHADAAHYRARSPFHVAVAAFVLNEIPPAKLASLMTNVRRNLGRSGRFVALVPHPAFAYAERTQLVRRTGIELRDYLKEGLTYTVNFRVAPTYDVQMKEYHFPLGLLLNTLVRSGFMLRGLTEVPGYDRSGIPFYLLINASSA
jgi:SAM-dependent methyltransferase